MCFEGEQCPGPEAAVEQQHQQYGNPADIQQLVFIPANQHQRAGAHDEGGEAPFAGFGDGCFHEGRDGLAEEAAQLIGAFFFRGEQLHERAFQLRLTRAGEFFHASEEAEFRFVQYREIGCNLLHVGKVV